MLRIIMLGASGWLLVQTALAETALNECWAESANRIALGECLNSTKADADAQLDEVYTAALAVQGELDAITGDSRATRALERSEMAFKLYRNLECHVRELQMGSGTGSGDAFLGCWIDMTRERIAALSELLPAERDDSLVGTWRVVEVDGKTVLPDAQPTVRFDGSGQINGNAGCNGFFGPVKVEDRSIEVSELLGVTMKVCGEAIDDQELRFLRALQTARRLEIDQDGMVLSDAQGRPLLRLERMQ